MADEDSRSPDEPTASAVTVTLLEPTAPRARALVARVPSGERRWLFDGDLASTDGRLWDLVDCVAIAVTADDDVGLATLGLDAVPVVIGLWVAPAARRHGVGTRLLLALAAESERRYGGPPEIDPVTPAGARAIEAARRTGAQLVVVRH
jgi:GNAT superfamily N-acetyltransferase